MKQNRWVKQLSIDIKKLKKCLLMKLCTCSSIYLNDKASSNINGMCISVYTNKKEEFIPNFVKFYLGQKLV